MKPHTPLFRLLGITFVTSLLFFSCEKNEITTPPEQATFLNQTGDAYFIVAPDVTYELKVGVTTVSDKDRTVAYTVTSPTGAVLGADYTLESPVVTIPAGQSIGTIIVKGNLNAYQAGEKDTLVFTLQSPQAQSSSVAASDYNSVFKLFMRGPCIEDELNQGIVEDNLAAFAGPYQVRESGWNQDGSAAYTDYGPYPATVSNVTLTSPTTADFRLSKIYEVDGWTGTFTLDWTDINDRKVTCTANIIGPGSLVGLDGYNISVEPVINPATPPEFGTFSYCSQTITVRFMIGVNDATTGDFLGYLSASSNGGAGTFSMSLTK